MRWQCVAGLFCLAAWLFSVSPAKSFTLHDPSHDWRTLESDNFRIHYPAELESLAHLTASICEEVHAELVPRLGWRPREPTEVLLVDEFDQSNGFARPIPYNMMGLFVSPPEPGGFIQVDSVEQWLEELIVHEYTHILHIDRVRGAPSGLRNVFGRQVFAMPNIFNPTWIIEGLATHYESGHYHGPGRGQDSEFEMMMRGELIDGVRPLAQVNIPNTTWPAGRVPYLYGVHFFQFLEETRGDDAIETFLDSYSGQLIPFRLNSRAQFAFGADFRALWPEFEAWLEARYGPQLDRIREAGKEIGEPLTDRGEAGRQLGGNLDVDEQGRVYVIRDDGHSQSRLMRLDPEEGSREVLTEVNRGARFRVHPDAGIMLAQPQVCEEYRNFYDLYHLPMDGGRKQRLTRCSRYRDIAWHPDGDKLAAVRFEQGQSMLDLIDADGERMERLAETDVRGLISQPAFSPDGQSLVVSRSEYGEGGDLYLLDLDSREWTRLTDDAEQVIHPRFDAAGEHVLFTSDHGDVFDVRRLTLDTGESHSLTRSTTGSFQGIESPRDGALYFLTYTSDGYQLRHRPMPEALEALPEGSEPHEPLEERELITEESRDYVPWGNLRPRAWFPYLRLEEEANEAGAVLFSEDARGVHRYQVLPVLDFSNEDLIGAGVYGFSDRLFLSYVADNRIRRDEEDKFERARRNETGGLALRLPVTRLERRWSFNAGYIHDRERDARLADDAQPRPAERDDVYGLALVHDDTRGARLAISAQEGRRVQLVGERHGRGGAYQGDVRIGDWREYLHLGRSHVLALRGVRGDGGEKTRPFSLGGARGAGIAGLDLVASPAAMFNRRRYQLRGYPEGASKLQGRNMELASAEYRFPLGRVERTAMAPPVGLRQWSGKVFAESGRAWDDNGETREWRSAAGVEALLDLNFGYQWVPVRLRVGYARGFDEAAGGGDEFHLTLGASF